MIADILKGIDRCDDEYTDGWWETSSGAIFGRNKLIEAQGYECGLLQRITELESQLADTKKDAERGRYMIKHGGWIRHDDYTSLEVIVAKDADLSCVAMRENAIDAAIAEGKA